MAQKNKAADPKSGWAWRLGQIVQGIVMGILLSVALLKLITLGDGAVTFLYQGF